MAESNSSVSVTLSGVSDISAQLNSLADNIQTTLDRIKATVSSVADGAINGDAPGALITEYEVLNSALITYPARLADMAATLSQSGDIYEAVDTAAATAASGN